MQYLTSGINFMKLYILNGFHLCINAFTSSKSTATSLEFGFFYITTCDQLPGAQPKSSTVSILIFLFLSNIYISLNDARLR